MRAVVLTGQGEVEVQDVSEPQLEGPRDAVVKVALAGICGSDMHLYHLRTPGAEAGITLGHEFVGVVEEVGAQVTRVRQGDRVVGSFFTSCRSCWYCRRGWYCQCERRRIFGHGPFLGDLNGAQAERLLVPDADGTLEPVPSEVNDEDAIWVADQLSTGMFCVDRAEIKPGDTVGVVGCGPVGLAAIMCARAVGAGNIYAVDFVDHRLRQAERLGAIAIDANQSHPVEFVRERTDDRGVDVSLECVGAKRAVDTAIEWTRPAGTVSMVGVTDVVEYPLAAATAWLKDLTLRTGIANVPRHMGPLLQLIAAGRLSPASLISHRMPLDQAPGAYRMYDAHDCLKIVLTPSP